jgi:hypothetical protein
MDFRQADFLPLSRTGAAFCAGSSRLEFALAVPAGLEDPPLHDCWQPAKPPPHLYKVPQVRFPQHPAPVGR